LLLNRKVCPLPILISWEFSRHKYIKVRHNEDNTEKKAGLKYKQHYAHNTLFGAKLVSSHVTWGGCEEKNIYKKIRVNMKSTALNLEHILAQQNISGINI